MSFQIRRLEEKGKKRSAHLPEMMRNLPWRNALGLCIIACKPLYELGMKMYERRKHEEHVKRTFTIGISLVVALTIILLAFSLLLKVGALSMVSLSRTVGAPVITDENNVTNILLLGQGNEEHDGIDLTDTIIVASIDPSTRVSGARSGQAPSVVLLSLPRDLYFLHTEHMEIEKGKLNALWRDNRIALGKNGMEKHEASLTSLKQLKNDIGVVLGIPIHHVVKVDFTAFEEVVDAIGGIEVTVPETINDTEYPDDNYSYQTFHIDAGTHTLDGATALKYARTRHTTSDFDRSERQQQIIRAAMQKAKASGLLKKPTVILELFSILTDHIETDLSTRQMITLAGIGRDIDHDRFITFQINDVNGLYGTQLFKGGILYAPPRNLFDDAFVLLPVSIPEFPVTWKQVNTLGTLLFSERELYLDHPRIAIFNGGSPEGSARKLANEFTKFGFDVVSVSNMPNRKEFPESALIMSNPDFPDRTAKFIGTMLAMPTKELSDEWQSTLAGKDLGDIAIILGENFSFQHFQNLISVLP